MGQCCQQRPTIIPGELATQHAASKDIEENIFKDIEEENKITKCLLLGAGECGKSTILKQMKLLHDNGFSDAELRGFIPLIRKNTLEAMQCLCNLVIDTLKLPFNNDDNRVRATRFTALNLAPNEAALGNTILSGNKPSDYVMDILALWKGDEGIQKAYAQSRAHDLSVPDSAEYFLNSVERTFDPAYLPTDMDVLRARSTTVGIQQIDFNYERRRFRMYDVGGQRGDRKKWIHYFSGVSVILWVASLSEYNQHLVEDATKNRLVESVKLFEALSAGPWFRDKPMILFLNKADLFRAKIETIDLGTYFPKYTGRKAHFQDGVEFIKEMFLERSKSLPVPPHHHHHHHHHRGAGGHSTFGHHSANQTHSALHIHPETAAATTITITASNAGSSPALLGGAAAAAAAAGGSNSPTAAGGAAGLSIIPTNGSPPGQHSPPATNHLQPYSSTNLHAAAGGGAGGAAAGMTSLAAASSSRSNMSTTVISRSNIHSHVSASGERVRRPKVVYTHITDATSTETIGIVWRVSIGHILENSKMNGFLA